MFSSTFPHLILQFCQLIQGQLTLLLWPSLRVVMAKGKEDRISYPPLGLDGEPSTRHQEPLRPKRQGSIRCPYARFPWGQGGGFGFIIVPLTTQDIRGLKKELPPYLDDPIAVEEKIDKYLGNADYMWKNWDFLLGILFGSSEKQIILQNARQL